MAQVAAVLDEQLALFDLGVNVTRLREELASLLSFKRSHGTHRGYNSDWKIFAAFCESTGRASMPASIDTVKLFMAAELGKGAKVSTVERKLAAIAYAHRRDGQPNPLSPECREILTCARVQRREKKEGKKPILLSELIRISRRLPDTNRGVRDRALLVFGLASGLRRSELARLDLKDVQFSRKGLTVDISWSKADQQARGRIFGIFAGERECTDPVRCMKAWLKVRGKAAGPLFTRVERNETVTLDRLCDLAINRVVKSAVRRIQLDAKDYSAHSMRAGLVTTAADFGASDSEIMRASGHKTHAVMRQYIRYDGVFSARNPLAGAL